MARADYTLVVLDENGQERRDLNGDLGSQKAIARMNAEASTDIFLMSHGWMGDIPAAMDQYNRWTDALLACPGDIAHLAASRPGFKPLMIGIHWPSLPWGDEQVIASFGFDGTATAPAFDPIEDYTARLGGTPEIQQAVQNIYSAIAASPNPNQMTAELQQAYVDLDRLLGHGAEGPAASPSADRAPFDPKLVFSAVQDAEEGALSFGGFGLGGLLSPLRTLSFWHMKDRGRKLGETAGAALVTALQQAAGSRDVRFHLMGHSFGCVVVSSIALRIQKPVQSLVLVQGALSLWSYSPSIAKAGGLTGYFNSVAKGGKVTGPIVTTQSQFDLAVGRWYPWAAGLVGQVSFDTVDFPIFGGVGTFGLQGVDHTNPLQAMLAFDKPYQFQAGQIYNIRSDNVIFHLDGGTSGAHSDIAHPEVGHVIWEAALTGL